MHQLEHAVISTVGKIFQRGVTKKVGLALLLNCVLRRARALGTKKTIDSSPFPLLLLPPDTIINILACLSTRELIRLGSACKLIRTLEREMRTSFHLVHISPSFNLHRSEQSAIFNIDSKNLTVLKNDRPGCGYVVCNEPVNTHSTYWEIKLDRFLFHRCEIGVCAKRALTPSGLDRSHAWLMDCWGHKCYNHTRQEYGMKMRTGDVIGVLYNKKDDTVSFFENGRNMGVAFAGLRVRTGHLIPVVGLPLCPGEQVRFLPVPSQLQFPLHIRDSACCPSPCWTPAPHPDDENVVIESLSNKAYRFRADPATTTVGELKDLLAVQSGYPAYQIALQAKGINLADDFTLARYGINFTEKRSQTQEILFYVAHEMS